MRIRIRWRRWLTVLAGIAATALIILYCIAPSMILHPRRITFPRTLAEFNVPGEKIQIIGANTVHLSALWIHDTTDTLQRPVIIMLHGIGNCKERWIPTGQWLWKAGFETVLLDQRAHGESGGQCCTFGYYEKYDVQAVVNYILQRRPNAKIGIWGHSLGGAVALQSLAIEPRIQFGIVESTFSDFKNVVYDYQKRLFKLPWRGFANDAIRRAAEEGHFDPDQIRPAESARKIHQPIFMGHGDHDERIQLTYGQEIFNNIASTDKQFYIVPNGDHSNIGQCGGIPYQEAIGVFLARMK